MKKQNQQGHDTAKAVNMQVVMPLELGIRIPEDDSVRLLIQVTERMDYAVLNRAYARESRRGEATPKQLFQLVVLGRMKGKFHVRELTEACRTDIRFMYILGGKRVPSASRFARFIQKRLSDGVMEALFYQLVLLLREDGEVAFEHLFVDGTKLEAYANRYTFVWRKGVEKGASRLADKLEALLAEIRTAYPFALSSVTDAEEIPQALLAYAEATGQAFVHGKGRRKPVVQRQAEQLRALLDKRKEYAQKRALCGERNSYSKTDPDATFMRMKEDHMGNGQLKPAYNLQLGVEAQYIVGVDVRQDRNDAQTLLPLLDRMRKHDCPVPRNIVCDAGYESEENYVALDGIGSQAYIKPQNYERGKKRSFRHNAFLRENMPYDAEADCYTCPAGKRLMYQYETTSRTKSGYEQRQSVYVCEDCGGCPQKLHCTKAKGDRKLAVSKVFDACRAASLARITSEYGILLRVNRSIQSEGTFGALKENWLFRRTLRRGMPNVMTEALLYAFAFDVEKLHTKTLSGTLKQHLLYPSSA